MRIVNSIYPYPVLSINDPDYQADSSFVVHYRLEDATPFKNAVLYADFELHDQVLNEQIELDKAGFYLHIENSRAAFRRLIPVEPGKTKISFEIDPRYLRQKVEITGFLLAKDTIIGLRNASINSDLYGPGYVFPDLEPGDPLAVSFTINLDVSDIDSFQNISSIMKVTSHKDKEMKVNNDGDVVYIYLPEKIYQQYVRDQDLPNTSLSIVIMPALLQLLNFMAQPGTEELSDKRWYQVIEKKMQANDFEVEDLYKDPSLSLKVAQILLEMPLDRAFDEIERLTTDED